jgi:hypothetical protein
MAATADVFLVQAKPVALETTPQTPPRGAPGGIPVEERIGPGLYRIRLGGHPLEVAGPEGLKPGDLVRVVGEKAKGGEPGRAIEETTTLLQGSVLGPLAFGGVDASFRVEVFAPKEGKPAGESPAVFFLVETDTEHVGKTQWGIHLRDHRLGLQVYLEKGEGPLPLEGWVSNLLDRLTALGYRLEHPLQRLKGPLRAPRGYGVSVRG